MYIDRTILDLSIYMYIYIYMNTYIYIYVYMYIDRSIPVGEAPRSREGGRVPCS